MAAPTIVSGKLVNAAIADFGGMRVEATYLATAAGADAPARQSVLAAADGRFSFELPAEGEWKAPLALVVTGGSGRVLGELKDLKAEDPVSLEIAVAADIAPTQITPSADPTLGATARFTGRVIDSRGNPQRAGLLIVLWGRATDAPAARPIAVADTVTGGYFAGEWPADVLTEAFAKVAGTDPIPVPLDGDRLPRRIVLVVDQVPDADSAANDLPRAPTAEELAQQSEAFADDAGCCQTFTTPNRTVEEVVFHAVVRTTQPEIQGAGVRKQRVIPPSIVTKILSLTRMQPLMLDARAELPQSVTMNTLRSAQLELRDATAPRNVDEAVRRGVALMRPASDATLAAAAELQRTGTTLGIAERAQLILETRHAQAQPLRLEFERARRDGARAGRHKSRAAAHR